METTIELKIKDKQLDEALKKANQLVSLLKEARQIIDSLSERKREILTPININIHPQGQQLDKNLIFDELITALTNQLENLLKNY